MSETKVEVKTPEFAKYVSVQYEEFDIEAFFSEIIPFIRTPHRCYKIEKSKDGKTATMELLIGVTHPILFRVGADQKTIEKLEEKLRIYGFKRASWEWK